MRYIQKIRNTGMTIGVVLFSFMASPQQDASKVETTRKIGQIEWQLDYDRALRIAREKQLPLWLHFGEHPGWAGCQHFARGPLCDKQVVKSSKSFVPVFIDTLNDLKTTKRFKERYGSYPVLRIHDLDGKDIGGRIDGNKVSGKIPVPEVLKQLAAGKKAFQQQDSRKRESAGSPKLP